MKKNCFFSLLFLLSLVATSFAAPVANIDVFVAKTGSDTYGNGSEKSPYQTLVHAVLKASSGQTVGLADGIYKETLIKVPSMVSITSISKDASKVIIRPAYSLGTSKPFFQLSSPNPGSSGNQSVSYLTFDGDVDGGGKAARGIRIQNRNDVRIHHCTIRDFGGAVAGGGVFVESTSMAPAEEWWKIMPHDAGAPGDDSSFALTDWPWPSGSVENFEFDHNTVITCGLGWNTDTDPKGHGQLILWLVKDSQIHDNVLDNSAIGDHCIKGAGGCTALLWNVDFYDNEMHMKRKTDKNFGFETWVHRGGCEIYGNTFDNLSLSITEGKETHIYNNTIIHDPPLTSTNGQLGIEFTYQSYSTIDSNYIEGCWHSSIAVGTAKLVDFWKDLRDVYITNNICIGDYLYGITVTAYNPHTILEGFKVLNNTIYSDRLRYAGLRTDAEEDGTLENTLTANNIVVGCVNTDYAGRSDIKTGGTYTNNTITNNLFYGNVCNDWRGDTDVGTVIDDPDFVGGTGADAYKLQAGSPAIGAGVPVSLTYDFAGNRFSISHPSIGAYEYKDIITLSETKILPPANLKVTHE